MATDFEKEVVGIAALVPEEHELEPETVPIAIEALEAVDGRYGPDGDNPRSFHNAPHSVGVTRRAVRMANILLPYVRPEYRDKFYDLSIIAGAAHDYDQDSGPGTNEQNSANYAASLVEAADGKLNTQLFKDRLERGILATTVAMQPDGEIVQVDLSHGSHDPIKFSMAFSDINGIAMEGSKRMWRDATNLYYEITPEPSIEGLYAFLVSQAGFLSDRLNPGRVQADIGYYFGGQVNEIYDDMYKAFHDNIVMSHGLAVKLGGRPELQNAIGFVARTIDRLHVGAEIGKMLTRELAADQ